MSKNEVDRTSHRRAPARALLATCVATWITLGVPALASAAEPEPAAPSAHATTWGSAAWGPRTLPYEEDAPEPPPGYHLQRRQRTGMLIAGAILGGTGGWLFLAGVAGCVDADGCGFGSSVGLFLGGVLLAPALPLLLVGLLTEKREWVRDAPAPSTARPWSVRPNALTSRSSVVGATLAVDWRF